jgi:hypothetical protein
MQREILPTACTGPIAESPEGCVRYLAAKSIGNKIARVFPPRFFVSVERFVGN